MRIAVTGGSGQVGTYVVRELVAASAHAVTVIDRVPPSVEGVRWVRAALDDLGEVIGALAGAEAVIHLAAYPVPYREVPDHTLFRNNVLGTYHVHEAARQLGIKRIALASSGAVLGWAYGQPDLLPQYLPIDEDHPCSPQDPYGLGKQCEEQIARAFASRCNMETIALRFSWVVFPEAAAMLRERGGRPVTRFDTYAYVDPRDAATACRQAVELPDLGHAALFIAADDSCCTEPLADALPRVVPKLADMARALPGMQSALTCARAKELLRWQPRHSWRAEAGR
jgi:nucleoside-diphosphate-sugar epimerase